MTCDIILTLILSSKMKNKRKKIKSIICNSDNTCYYTCYNPKLGSGYNIGRDLSKK